MEKFHKTRGPDLGIKNAGIVPPAKAGEESERLIVEQRYAYQFKPTITGNGNDGDDSRKEMVAQRNLSQQEIKIRILSYLYNKEEGCNAHNIQFHAVPGRTQEASRFKVLLVELCNLDRIQEVDMSHVTKGRVIYKITDKGRRTIIHLRNPLIKEFLGLVNEEI